MAVSAPPRPAIRYRALYPAWEGKRPLGWFFAEQLLEARAESDFPTNARGDDEDVNIYLMHLLTTWATRDPRDGVMPGRDPVLLPPDPAANRRCVAEHYRRQADHRLMALGLFDRGDLVRRKTAGWRMTPDETRRRDMAAAECCYSMAADVLDGRKTGPSGLIIVWRKLAARLPDYVHILQALARRRLGLGARLSDAELGWLLKIG